MLQELCIMLLSSAPKITYFVLKKMLIILKIMPLILASNVCKFILYGGFYLQGPKLCKLCERL